MIHFNLRKGILTCGYFILFITSGIHVSAACTNTNNNLNEVAQPFLTGTSPYESHTQGMCIAENYIVWTRTSDSDSSETTYVVLDLKSKEEKGHYTFHTGHSNSLTYNSKKKELAVVTDGYVYLFDFNDGKMTQKDSFALSVHGCKVAYVSSKDYYVVSTGPRVFKTKNFKDLDLLFQMDEKGTNQGMGSDGENLYIIWYEPGNNKIEEYSLDGKYIRTLSATGDSFSEIEELDFQKGNMYLNNTQSGTSNGIYLVPAEHHFSKFKTVIKKTCLKDRKKERICSGCGLKESKIIHSIGHHKESDWIIKKEASCEKDGFKIKICTVCKKELKKEKIPATGHNFSEWKQIQEPTVFEKGIEKRICVYCHKEETQEEDMLTPTISLDNYDVEMAWYEKGYQLNWELEKGDYITEIFSRDNKKAKVSTDGYITPKFPGKTDIIIKTKTGLTATCHVKIKLSSFTPF